MKNLSHIHISLPERFYSLIPHTYDFNTRDKYHRSIALFLLWVIRNSSIKDKLDHDEWVFIPKSYWRSIITSYNQYLKLFQQLGIMECNRSYSTGSFPKSYRLVYSPDETFAWRTITNKKIINKINNIRLNSFYLLTPEQEQRRKNLHNIKIDILGVIDWLNTNPYCRAKYRAGKTVNGKYYRGYTRQSRAYTVAEKDAILLQCNKFNSGIHHYTIDKNGREHHPLTNLPEHIRKNFIKYNTSNTTTIEIPHPFIQDTSSSLNFISIYVAENESDGIGFVEKDIKTSQPRFLGKWLEGRVSADELDKYKQLVNGGDIYMWMAERYNETYKPIKPKTRSEMKMPFLKILYCRPTTRNRLTCLFKDAFPEASAAIVGFKRKYGHEALANSIQRLESDFVYNYCRGLDVPYYTVHDSVAVLDGVYIDFLEQADNYFQSVVEN